MQYYPQNTVAQYTTKLNSLIELQGDWEVGLTEISVPSKVENTIKDRCYFYIYDNTGSRSYYVIDPYHHRHIQTVINALNDTQNAESQLARSIFASFSYERRKKRIKVQLATIGRPSSAIADAREPDEAPGIEFSPDLALLTGFDSNFVYRGFLLTAEREPHLRDNIFSMYVYCDLLEHVPVGDTKAPLLRIVDKPTRDHGNTHQVLNPVLYVPLQKKHFDTVEINIMTDCGLPVPFLAGKSFAVLEFRRAVHPYFAI